MDLSWHFNWRQFNHFRTYHSIIPVFLQSCVSFPKCCYTSVFSAYPPRIRLCEPRVTHVPRQQRNPMFHTRPRCVDGGSVAARENCTMYSHTIPVVAIAMDDKQRVLMHGHQRWNVRHGLCHIYMRYVYIYIYIYIWVVYSFRLFCCLFIVVTWWYVWCIEWASGNQEKVQACLVTVCLFIISCCSLYKTTLCLLCSWFENNPYFHKYSTDFHV